MLKSGLIGSSRRAPDSQLCPSLKLDCTFVQAKNRRKEKKSLLFEMYLAAGSNYESDLFSFGVKIDASLSPREVLTLKLLLVLATLVR